MSRPRASTEWPSGASLLAENAASGAMEAVSSVCAVGTRRPPGIDSSRWRAGRRRAPRIGAVMAEPPRMPLRKPGRRYHDARRALSGTGRASESTRATEATISGPGGSEQATANALRRVRAATSASARSGVRRTRMISVLMEDPSSRSQRRSPACILLREADGTSSGD